MSLASGNSNRQRMINLMYIIFLAMMILGVRSNRECREQGALLDASEARDRGTAHTPASTTSYVVSSVSSRGASTASVASPESLRAYIIPESSIVVQGNSYRAQVMLGYALPSDRAQVVVNGEALPTDAQGMYTSLARRSGTYPIQGYVQYEGARYPFATHYTATAPTASVATRLTNVLYSGIDNPITIAVPSVAEQDIVARLEGGQIVRQGSEWIARPASGAKEAILHISARTPQGEALATQRIVMRVRPLPDPLPYLEVGGQPFRGGRISRSVLLGVRGLEAAIDDSALNIPFEVMRFQLVSFDSLGNAIPEMSEGRAFSERQRSHIRNSARGKRLYITEVVARGPDGIERKLSSIELIIQ